MEQMKPTPDMDVVEIDFENREYHSLAKLFRPLVYREQFSFCVLLGRDPQTGILGFGASVDAALEDWVKHFYLWMKLPAKDESLSRFVDEMLKASVYKIN